jgi:hypothetical protein
MKCSAEGNNLAAWLKERRLAADHRIPYFVRWVEGFRRFRATRPAESWGDTLRVFLGDLDDGQVPAWQIRQAADAVSLFFGQYLATNMGGNPGRRDKGRLMEGAQTLWSACLLGGLHHRYFRRTG